MNKLRPKEVLSGKPSLREWVTLFVDGLRVLEDVP